MNVFLNVLLRAVSYIFGAALVLLAVWETPKLLVSVLDFNLAMIGWLSELLPIPYNDRIESTLRLALHADKALLFAEGTWIAGAAIRGIVYVAKKPFRTGK